MLNIIMTIGTVVTLVGWAYITVSLMSSIKTIRLISKGYENVSELEEVN